MTAREVTFSFVYETNRGGGREVRPTYPKVDFEKLNYWKSSLSTGEVALNSLQLSAEMEGFIIRWY